MTQRHAPGLEGGHVASTSYPQIASVEMRVCILCGMCIGVCPEGAISMDESVTIDRRLCAGCGTCITTCPTQALSFWYESPAPSGAG